jgi:hypothetical protein
MGFPKSTLECAKELQSILAQRNNSSVNVAGNARQIQVSTYSVTVTVTVHTAFFEFVNARQMQARKHAAILKLIQ